MQTRCYARTVNRRRASMLAAAWLGLSACQSPPPPTGGQPAPPAPVITVRPDIVVPPPAMADAAPSPTARLAPRDPSLEKWKLSAAERIHEVNRKELFEGRPEHLLRAVIVIELTVDRQGNVTHSKVMRSPGIAALNSAALRSLKAASPLPAPPPSLIVKGGLVFQETWLFRKDGRFRLRSLSLPQE